MNSGIYNPATATCGSGCETCYGCTSYLVSDDPFEAIESDPEQAYGQCVWENGSLQGYTDSSSWSSSSTSVITVQTEGQSNPGLTSPHTQGAATLFAELPQTPVNMGQVCGTLPLPPCQYTQATPSATVTVEDPSWMVVVSDVIGTCEKCSSAVLRDVTYSVKNNDGSSVGKISICENPSTSNWSCSQKEPALQYVKCGWNPALNVTTPDGELTDSWSIGADGFTPSGCGFNVTDMWMWDRSPAEPQSFGRLTGIRSQHQHHDQSVGDSARIAETSGRDMRRSPRDRAMSVARGHTIPRAARTLALGAVLAHAYVGPRSPHPPEPSAELCSTRGANPWRT